MNFKECMDFIGSYSRLGGRVTDLSRARELMERIGNPQNSLKFVHIAGTNGKGSTTEYIAKGLELSGYKTGILTSPYVTHYTDRIRINSADIDEKSLGEICDFVSKKAADREYSQFEITMAIAFLWYEREKCDIVVLETGIGGLLDSTNVIPPPILSVLTSISFDHTAILGNTIEEIAVQKAGIIKKSSAVILSMDNFSLTFDIVRRKAEEENAEFIIPDESQFNILPFNGRGCSFIYKNKEYNTSMLGRHQAANAVTAIETLNFLTKKGFDISEENITKALKISKIEARVQYLNTIPPTIVDGGHNISGIAALKSVLNEFILEGKKLYSIMGMVDSKDYVQCVKNISECFEKIFTVDKFAENAVAAAEIAEIGKEFTSTEPSVLREALEKARILAMENDGIVVICGSLYLASEYLNLGQNR